MNPFDATGGACQPTTGTPEDRSTLRRPLEAEFYSETSLDFTASYDQPVLLGLRLLSALLVSVFCRGARRPKCPTAPGMLALSLKARKQIFSRGR